MNPKQLKALVDDILHMTDLYSPESSDLLMLTLAHESMCGQCITQLGGGPALGIFQMEPATLADLKENYLKFRPELMSKLELVKAGGLTDEMNLRSNLAFQIVAARLQYQRFPTRIPTQKYLDETIYFKDLSYYWKTHWNTVRGKGTVDEAINNYKRYVK